MTENQLSCDGANQTPSLQISSKFLLSLKITCCSPPAGQPRLALSTAMQLKMFWSALKGTSTIIIDHGVVVLRREMISIKKKFNFLVKWEKKDLRALGGMVSLKVILH